MDWTDGSDRALAQSRGETVDDPRPEPEREAYFIDCTCEHEPNQHGWRHCDAKDCTCEGHWEE